MRSNLQAQRATKKQRELLSFIDGFVKGNGYGPSYREIMRALEYKSVSTVATHVKGLVDKGYLVKTDASARSLAVAKQPSGQPTHEQWLTRELRKKRQSLASERTARSEADVAAIDRVVSLFDITL